MSADRNLRPASRSARLLAVVASLALALVVVQVPPCEAGTEACPVEARPSSGAHCPLEMAMGTGAAMDCCLEDAAPSREPVPAAPAPTDDLRVQLKAPAPVLTAATSLVAALPSALPVRGASAVPAAPAVPLYTLLSTLLN